MPDHVLVPDHGQDGLAASAFALFLDFDGTLVEIAERPDAVVVEAGLADTLALLGRRLGGALAIVTGRPIAVIDGFLAPYRFDAAGLHGVEQRRGGRLSPCRSADHPRLRAVVAELEHRFADEPGILIEDKGCSVALHWRLAPERADDAALAATEIAAALGAGYRLQLGKAVAEMLPAYATKASMIVRFLEEPPYRGRRPVFAGDDLTDEPAFEAVNARGGISIRVGPGPTRATCRLATPADLRGWLARFAERAHIDFEAVARE